MMRLNQRSIQDSIFDSSLTAISLKLVYHQTKLSLENGTISEKRGAPRCVPISSRSRAFKPIGRKKLRAQSRLYSSSVPRVFRERHKDRKTIGGGVQRFNYCSRRFDIGERASRRRSISAERATRTGGGGGGDGDGGSDWSIFYSWLVDPALPVFVRESADEETRRDRQGLRGERDSPYENTFSVNTETASIANRNRIDIEHSGERRKMLRHVEKLTLWRNT